MKKFEVNGRIYETNEKGNRYFVSYGNIVKKRISQMTYENAEAEWQAEADAELKARQEEQDRKDLETENAFNGKEEKQPKRVRRSKDVAFEMDTIEGHITLTAKQVDFIKHLPDTCFWEHGLESALWCDVLADEIGGQFAGKPMTVGAMISTLREKKLVAVNRDVDRKGKPKYMVLTVVGQVIAQKLGLN